MKLINCNFCNNEKTKLLYKTKDRMLKKADSLEFYLHQCQECGLAYLNPQPEWKDLEYFYGGDYYTNAPIGGNHNIFYNLLRKFKRAVLGPPKYKFWDFNKTEGRFLDVGCGNGAYESYIIKDYSRWEFYGVEPSPDSFKVASTVKGFRVFNGNLEEAHYNDNFFDVILMSHSLEHLPNPLAALKECHRILKPGGRLVIGVPNFDCPARRFFGSYWLHLDAPRHLFHFSPNVLKAMLQNSGFSVVSLNFEVLSGSIVRSLAYRFNMNKFFFKTPLVMLVIHYLIWPINKLIESLRLASGLRVIAIKK
jgi:SAM-dependent methyltransferase